mmetsp:Transcript_1700/g.3547  ORF Transcript_1700/g.3547 Transcript_1700/m.3547 type:complete len:145 (-) Transcript_1700:840-1274(-)
MKGGQSTGLGNPTESSGWRDCHLNRTDSQVEKFGLEEMQREEYFANLEEMNPEECLSAFLCLEEIHSEKNLVSLLYEGIHPEECLAACLSMRVGFEDLSAFPGPPREPCCLHSEQPPMKSCTSDLAPSTSQSRDPTWECEAPPT